MSSSKKFIHRDCKLYGLSAEHFKYSSAYVTAPQPAPDKPYVAYFMAITTYGVYHGKTLSFMSWSGAKQWLEEHDLVEE